MADGDWAVPGALDGERLDRAVALATGISRGESAGLIEGGRVRVAGNVVTSRARRVRAGETVALDREPATAAADDPLAPDAAVAVPVVHCDAEVIVVDKPAGLVVHPGAGRPSGTMIQGLLARFPDLAAVSPDDPVRPGVVHRLDKGTSGLLVVARTSAARASLASQLAARTMGREYLALVLGSVRSDRGLVDAPLGRSDADPTRIRVQAGGRPARTRYQVEGRFARPVATTLVCCQLETGRTHQIRVHFSSIGHPLVGDDRYGGRPATGATSELAAMLPSGRPFLHAAVLSFEHPRSGERLTFSSSLPADLAGVLDAVSGDG